MNSDALTGQGLNVNRNGCAQIGSGHQGEVSVELLEQFAMVEAFAFGGVRACSGFREPEGYLNSVKIFLECEPMSNDCAKLPHNSRC